MTTQIAIILSFFTLVQTDNLKTDGIFRSADTEKAMQYTFTPEDEKLLDEIQYGCFMFFWKDVGKTGLAKDKMTAPISSIAAVGYQLSSLPIGVERGWITREQGEQRAVSILKTLIERDDNKKYGVYLHYPNLDTGGMSTHGFEVLASTVDHALLMAGAMPAATYFGGETAKLVDRLIEETNWRPFILPNGNLSMGWKPKDPKNMHGDGEFIRAEWTIASDEERITFFLAAGAPDPKRGLDPEKYYRLLRVVKNHKDMAPLVVSYPGIPFTYFFSHCWIGYKYLDADNPKAFGIDSVPVDWFENSRRAILTHRQRCIEVSDKYKTFSRDRWGQSPCSAKKGYIVPDVKPNLADKDNWHEGTCAPYAAGASIMFTPKESLEALRAFRNLKDKDGKYIVWRDPKQGGFGLVDSFNLDQNHATEDYVGIDHGPMLLGIENARTGLIWKLFMEHPNAQRAVKRLKLEKRK